LTRRSAFPESSGVVKFQTKKSAMPTASFLSLPEVLEGSILDYLTPTDFVHFTGVCRQFRKWQDRSHAYMSAVNSARLLHAVFDLRQNVLMHGPGGSGKSHALQVLYKQAEEQKRRVVMAGTTGVSGCNLPGGMTIHSFSGLGKATIPLAKLKEECETNPEKARKRYRQWREVEILVIDEVSMLGSRLYVLLEWLARFVRESNRPWGGLQLVFSGDYMQLPPIGDKFIFTLPEYQNLGLRVIPFLTSFRQKDDKVFFKMLSRIRLGNHTEKDIDRLLARKVQALPQIMTENVGKAFVPPLMFSRHKQVNVLNKARMDSLPDAGLTVYAQDELVVFVTTIDPVTKQKRTTREPYEGPDVIIPQALLDRIEHRQPRQLLLKPMAQYILTQNFRTQLKLVNGAVCMTGSNAALSPLDYVLTFKDKRKLPLGAIMSVQYYRVLPRSNVFLQRRQYSLRVGYAVTIHSAQSMTLDEAVVDAGSSVFANAQVYVACSRVRALKNLYLLDFHVKSLKVHHEAVTYVSGIEAAPAAPPKRKKATKRKSDNTSLSPPPCLQMLPRLRSQNKSLPSSAKAAL